MVNLERVSLVWGIVGNLGGGKSLTAVSIAVESLRRGFFVCSNITLKIPAIERYLGMRNLDRLYLHISLDDPSFDPFKLPCGDPRGSDVKRRVIVILDEVAEWLDQYSKANDPRIKNLWSWLRHSSKRSQDVFIICQRQEYINKVVRILIARWVWVDDLAVYRLPYIRMKIPFCKGKVLQNVFDRNGERIAGARMISKELYGRFYNTAECLNSSGASYNFVYQLPDELIPVNHFFLLLYLVSFFYLLFYMLC